jgi:MFS family permease
LLPVRVADLIGHDAAVSWLSYIAFFGAIAASVGYIGFGHLSDITGRRRLWIWGGLTLSCLLLMAVSWVDDLPHLIALVVCWQLSLNMMLAPLAAMAGDHVPDSRKGLLGGLMAFAPGLGAVSGALVTIPGFASPDARLVLIAVLAVMCVTPVLIAGIQDLTPAPKAASPPTPGSARTLRLHNSGRGALIRMWLARLTVQVAEASLFAFLYLWFRSIDPSMTDNRTASVFSAILLVSAPLAIVIGGWADRRAQPVLPMIVCAACAAIGLMGMALAHNAQTGLYSYALFGTASTIFLAQHSAQTLRVLRRPDRRGRDLGLFNLTNTLPSLIMPWFALTLVPYFGFSGLFVLLALLSIVTGVLLAPLARRS